jgi:signal transduction histidine kinase
LALSDITKRKKAEDELRQARDELELRVRERTAQLNERAAQLSRLASQLTLAEQKERSRLAQVLHDGLQQLLVAAKLRLGLMQSSEDPAVRREAAELSDIIADCIATSRSLTAELDPPVLRQGGLVPALHWLARWMREKHGLAVSLDAPKRAVPVPETLALLLFQAVRELLFNVVKHAGVSAARVEVAVVDSCVRLAVIDEGVGFDPSILPGGDHFGLFAVRERLDLLGGRVEITSSPGRGSRFTLVAPLCAPSNPPPAHAPSP